MATNAQLETLEKALSYDRPPFCSGTVLPSPEGFHLYYGKQDPKYMSLKRLPRYETHHTHRFIDFASSTPEQLDQLAVACDPATFGRGNQDVHDESYRKALKMDAAGFAVQFDPTAFGLIKTIEEGLLQGRTQKMRIRPEIYKLNVYGSLSCPPPPSVIFLTFPGSQEKTPSLKPIRTLPVARTCSDLL